MSYGSESSDTNPSSACQMSENRRVHFDGPMRPREWPQKYAEIFRHVQSTEKVCYDEYIGQTLNSDKRKELHVAQMCERAERIVRKAYTLRDALDEENWKGKMEALVFERFDSELECFVCKRPRWLADSKILPHCEATDEVTGPDRETPSFCECEEAARLERRNQESPAPMFSEMMDCFILDRDFSEQKVDHIIGLARNGDIDNLLSRGPPISAVPMKYAPGTILPFLLIGGKPEQNEAGFKYIEGRNAPALRIMIDRLCELETSTHDCPLDALVWFLAYQADEWRIYGCIAHEEQIRVIDLWHGSVLRLDSALQLLLIVDLLCDWAKSIYAKQILGCLRTRASRDPPSSTVVGEITANYLADPKREPDKLASGEQTIANDAVTVEVDESSNEGCEGMMTPETIADSTSAVGVEDMDKDRGEPVVPPQAVVNDPVPVEVEEMDKGRTDETATPLVIINNLPASESDAPGKEGSGSLITSPHVTAVEDKKDSLGSTQIKTPELNSVRGAADQQATTLKSEDNEQAAACKVQADVILDIPTPFPGVVRYADKVEVRFRFVTLPECDSTLLVVLENMSGYCGRIEPIAEQLLDLLNSQDPLLLNLRFIDSLKDAWMEIEIPPEYFRVGITSYISAVSIHTYIDYATWVTVKELSCITASVETMKTLSRLCSRDEAPWDKIRTRTPFSWFQPLTLHRFRHLHDPQLTREAVQNRCWYLESKRGRLSRTTDWVERDHITAIEKDLWATVRMGLEGYTCRSSEQPHRPVVRTSWLSSPFHAPAPWIPYQFALLKRPNHVKGAGPKYCLAAFDREFYTAPVINKDTIKHALLGKELLKFLSYGGACFFGTERRITEDDMGFLHDWAGYLVKADLLFKGDYPWLPVAPAVDPLVLELDLEMRAAQDAVYDSDDSDDV